MIGSNHTTEPAGGGYLLVKGQCPLTKQRWSVEVVTADYEAWQRGQVIQDAMPYLDADSRELLQTGYTPEAWDQLFGEED